MLGLKVHPYIMDARLEDKRVVWKLGCRGHPNSQQRNDKKEYIREQHQYTGRSKGTSNTSQLPYIAMCPLPFSVSFIWWEVRSSNNPQPARLGNPSKLYPSCQECRTVGCSTGICRRGRFKPPAGEEDVRSHMWKQGLWRGNQRNSSMGNIREGGHTISTAGE